MKKLQRGHFMLIEHTEQGAAPVYIYILIPGGVLGDRWLEVLGEPGVNRWDRGVFLLEALTKGA